MRARWPWPPPCPDPAAAPAAAGAQLFTCYQELKLQERSNGVDPGTLPGSLTVILQDELADRVQPGGG
jgi:DNA replicative helicase MCM subunit Mcm2 (Cdc46/Mcm family)